MSTPVSLDFLEDIVAVQWHKGPPPIPSFSWIAIEQIGAINAFVNTTFTISVAGAEVGSFTPFDGTQNAHGAAFYCQPGGLNQPASGSMLSGTIAPSGGISSVNGFALADDQPFNLPHTILFLKLDQQMPKKPFKVIVTNNVDGAIGTAQMTIVATVMKKIAEGDTFYPNVTSQITTHREGLNHSPVTYTFDPKKLKVTGG